MRTSRGGAHPGRGSRRVTEQVLVPSPPHPELGCPRALWPGTRGTAWQKAALASLGRRKSAAAPAGALLSLAAYNYTPSPQAEGGLGPSQPSLLHPDSPLAPPER